MNANKVLENVEKLIEKSEAGKTLYGRAWTYRISDVYDELSIFDWWNENLSLSQLKQMRSFLKTAIKLGYTGYVCFRVGAKYCSHGMWAYKKESTNGYSPNGARLFHSFRSGDNYWDAENDNGTWLHDLYRDEHKIEFTLKEIKEFIGG